MFIDLTPEQKALRQQLRDYFANLMTADDRAQLRGMEGGERYRKLIRKIGGDGWLGVGWPKEFGGGGMTMVEQMKSDLHLVEEKVQEARRKRETLLMKKRAADAKKKMAESAEKARQGFDSSAGSIINGFDSFSRFEAKIEKELAEAEAREELSRDLRKPDLDRKFSQLAENDEVEDELAALKKKLKNKK